MRHPAALLLPLAAALSASAAEAPDLAIEEAAVRFAADDRARIDLAGDLVAESGDDPATLRVTVGGTVVLDAAARSDRARVRTNSWGDYLLRDRAHLGEGCRLRLKAVRGSGRFRIRLTGFDGAALRAAGPAGVAVRVEVSGRTAEARVDFEARSPRRWTWRADGRTHVGPVVPPPPPVQPPPPPGVEPFAWTMISYGGNSGITTPTKTVIRDAAAFQALWNLHAPGTPVPSADFSREMILVCIAGPGQPTNRVLIWGEILGNTLFLEARPGRNVTADTNTSPHCMVRANRNDLAVVWK